MPKADDRPTILLGKKGIYAIEGGVQKRIGDRLQVVSFVTSHLSTGELESQALTELEFSHRDDGRIVSAIVPAALLVSRDAIVAKLADLGYAWPESKYRKFIAEALAARRPTRRKEIVLVPGWHRKRFALPDEWIVRQNVQAPQIELQSVPTVKLGAFLSRGTLSDWKERIAKIARHSSRGRLFIAAALAGPTLRIVNHSSFGLNAFGATSSGKTLLLRLAASVWGLNAGQDLTSLVLPRLRYHN
jgi:putative DNA primase/helicase